MAKGKKSKSSGKMSNGERANVSQKLINKTRLSIDGATRMVNTIKEWRAGKNPWVTIENPDKNNTKSRMIKVKANNYFGNPRKKQGEETSTDE